MTPTTDPPTRRRPPGRRAGDSGTRDAILSAALALFAERGYDGTSMRAIAVAAGVDPALIRHYFGDKETLFATTIADRSNLPALMARSLERSHQSTDGQQFTDTYLRLWEDPATQPVLRALVRSASTSPTAADLLRQTLDSHLQTEALAAEPEHARRVALAAAHLFGVAFARHVLRLPAVTALDHDDLVAAVAPAIQRYLDGS